MSDTVNRSEVSFLGEEPHTFQHKPFCARRWLPFVVEVCFTELTLFHGKDPPMSNVAEYVRRLQALLGGIATEVSVTTHVLLSEECDELVASVDGKTAKQSLDENGNPIHLINVFAHNVKVTLNQWTTNGDKTNEPGCLKSHLGELLKQYPMLKLLTGDAIFAQRPLMEVLKEHGCDYLFQLKENQGDAGFHTNLPVKSHIHDAIIWVKDTLIREGTFRLPGTKVLTSSEQPPRTVLIDVTESPIERPKKNKRNIICYCQIAARNPAEKPKNYVTCPNLAGQYFPHHTEPRKGHCYVTEIEIDQRLSPGVPRKSGASRQ